MVELIRRLGFLPQYCVWELTLRCNLRCGHCGSRAGVPRPEELSLEECLRVADDLIALHCHQISLSGGEPTLFEGWDRLGARLASGGVRVNLISNGWHFTGEHLARARDAGVENLAFSVDGLEADHDAIRGEGSFRRVLAAIDRSVEAGVDVAVNTTLDRVNARRLAALHELLGAHGVSHLQVQLGVPTGNLADRRERALDPVDLLWLIPDLAALRAARRAEGARPSIAVAENLGYYGRHERDLREVGRPIPFWTGCRAGCRVIGIESGGDLKPCLSLPSSLHGEGRFVEGNLRRAAPRLADRALVQPHRLCAQPGLRGRNAPRLLRGLPLPGPLPRRLPLDGLRLERRPLRQPLLFLPSGAPGRQTRPPRSRRPTERRGASLP
jgi:MoaA/NifB/PqqE/SkfB family radical SAM enzyme